MTSTPPAGTSRPPRPPTTAHRGGRVLRPRHIALVFTACGLAWILGGEWLAVRLGGQPARSALLQVLKGSLFVGATGMLLFVLLQRWQRDLERALSRGRDLAALGALVQAVAHQLKNPLFGLLAALEAFERRTGDDPATARHRALLREQAERIRVLVTAMQEYGQIAEPRRRPCDVGALAARIAAAWEPRVARAGSRLRSAAPAARELVAELDSEAVAQAIDRLLENALQHSPPGGEVRLAVCRRRAPDRLEIEVGDDGPGFRDEELERAPGPLYSRRPGGTGLGLAVAERIAQLHEGRLELGRSPSGGASVRLVLPL